MHTLLRHSGYGEMLFKCPAIVRPPRPSFPQGFTRERRSGLGKQVCTLYTVYTPLYERPCMKIRVHRPLREEVYDAVRRAIVQGELSPGRPATWIRPGTRSNGRSCWRWSRRALRRDGRGLAPCGLPGEAQARRPRPGISLSARAQPVSHRLGLSPTTRPSRSRGRPSRQGCGCSTRSRTGG